MKIWQRRVQWLSGTSNVWVPLAQFCSARYNVIFPSMDYVLDFIC
jgi:hypothetical protein